MAEQPPKPEVGTIGWVDLTVPDADLLKDFYREVVGWWAEPFAMGGYDDYVMMTPGTGRGVAGICHARGGNAGLPAQWLVYITVPDLDAALERCAAQGGSVIAPPKSAGGGRYAVIRDPAGAVAAL